MVFGRIFILFVLLIVFRISAAAQAPTPEILQAYAELVRESRGVKWGVKWLNGDWLNGLNGDCPHLIHLIPHLIPI